MKHLIYLLTLLGLTAVFITACSEDTPPVPATVAGLCTMQSNTWVVVEGTLSLTTFRICQEGNCYLDVSAVRWP